MKKIILFFYLLFFGTFITNAQNNNDLIFKDGNQTIKIEFETKQPYLELNKNTKFIVSVENIELQKTSIIGRGIRILGSNNKTNFECSVLVDENGLENGKFKMRLIYYNKDELKTHIFIIPVK